jgi:hypothetical protein
MAVSSAEAGALTLLKRVAPAKPTRSRCNAHALDSPTSRRCLVPAAGMRWSEIGEIRGSEEPDRQHVPSFANMLWARSLIAVDVSDHAAGSKHGRLKRANRPTLDLKTSFASGFYHKRLSVRCVAIYKAVTSELQSATRTVYFSVEETFPLPFPDLRRHIGVSNRPV